MSKKDPQKLPGSRKGRTRKAAGVPLKEAIKALLAENPNWTAQELSEHLGRTVAHIRSVCREAGVKLPHNTRGHVMRGERLREESDLAWAREVFGENYEHPERERDEEYEREMKERGRPGFYFVGEVWARYRDMFAHKQRGLTLTYGKWRPSTARDGVHQGETLYGIIDEKRIPVTLSLRADQYGDSFWDE